MRYDVIVIGAGPAGSTTARECASRGLSVLMLDRAEFPRDKPCGGGVSVRAADILPFNLQPVVERVATDMHLTMRQGRGFTRHSDQGLVLLTQRSRFDTFLVDQAIEAGVTLRQQTTLRDVERHPSHVIVRTREETFESDTLVGADGANGVTAKLAGIKVNLVHGVALEGNVTPNGAFPARWEQTFGLDVGCTPGGYGWIFPKGDHLNIGLGAWKYFGPNLRGQLDGLVRFYGFAPQDLWGLRGYHLPVRVPGSPLADGNMLLVGDAAGLLDPLTGEGIYSAMWSGRAAANHIAGYVGGEVPDLDGYRQEIERGLVPDLKVSRQFHDLFHLAPGFYIGIERLTSLLWDVTSRVLIGEQTYSGVMRNHHTFATVVDFLSDLIRVTPFLQRRSGLRDPAPPERFFLGSTRYRRAH
jgi:geranylgeranyl reductase family protein